MKQTTAPSDAPADLSRSVAVLAYLDRVERDRAAARTPAWPDGLNAPAHRVFSLDRVSEFTDA